MPNRKKDLNILVGKIKSHGLDGYIFTKNIKTNLKCRPASLHQEWATNFESFYLWIENSMFQIIKKVISTLF